MRRGLDSPKRSGADARTTRREPHGGTRERVAQPLAPPPDPRHPAFALAVLAAAACIVVTVSFRLYDTDMWQHFAVGRAIWQLHQVPTTQLWTWPTYGAPDVNASWGFRALIWPLWHAFGIPGMFAWRWVNALVVFGFVWLAARRMGARGLSPLIAIVLCSLTYRQRSHVRPETFVSALLAAQIWIHESWRARDRHGIRGPMHEPSDPAAALPPDLRPWLVVISWIWANAHISYWMGLAVQGIYLVGAWPHRGTPAAPLLERMGLRGWRAPIAVLGASSAISFLNPWGWKALWQPFEYFLVWRHEDIFKTIGELAPIDWPFNQRNFLAPLLIGAAVLLLWRARTRSGDAAELLMFGLFVPMALLTERFVGFLAVVLAPFVARDLDAWLRSRRLRLTPAKPSTGAESPSRAESSHQVTAGRRWVSAIACSTLCVAICLPEWTRTSMPLGMSIDWRSAPVRACDFIAEHGIRGRGFNQFAAGGYLVYRFWPDRSRLPFMDIHQAGTREDRYLYAWAQQDSVAWRRLDNKYRFDYVVLFTHQAPNDGLLDRLGEDRAGWALVFSDDAGAVFLRRDGPFAALAESLRYQFLPAGKAALNPTLARASTDPTLRLRLEAELTRAVRASPWNGRAKTALAVLADQEGRESDAVELLGEVIRDNSLAPFAHEYRAEIELAMGKAHQALDDLMRERRIQLESADLDFRLGRVYRQLGRSADARRCFDRAIQLEPGLAAARDSLVSLDRAQAR